MADSTLTAIRTKVRRLTRSPSTAQITDAEIDEYVNTFILYDFPEHLRLFTLRSTFTFFTKPNIDIYENSIVPGDQFYNFKNLQITTHKPAYIDGNRMAFSQSREEFYGAYPRTHSVVQIATGDGATMNFVGALQNVPILRNNVLFNSITATNEGLEVDDVAGLLAGDGVGTINYITGAYDFTFTDVPAAGQPVNAHTVPYTAARPRMILYFENKIMLRPVPDQAYRVDFEVYKRPTELLAGHSPDLEQWWQYISYGSSKKILEDRLDEEGVRMLMPEFKTQERLVIRRTIVQQAKDRVATIYSNPTGGGNAPGWWNR